MTEPARGLPLPVRIRLARNDDREAVMAFASTTWGGWDYIPHAWPEWIDATDGVLLIVLPQRPAPGEDAQVDADGLPLDPDVPIAISRFALLSPAEGWVEGIRVDPRVRGRSVATQLQIGELAWAAAHGISLIRYLTDEDNEGSHRLGAKHGFRLLGKVRGYGDFADVQEDERPFVDDEHDVRLREAVLSARGRTLDALRVAGLVADPLSGDATVEELWSMVDEDPTFGAGHRLYESRPWTVQELTRERFVGHLRAGEVVAGPAGQVLAGPAGEVLAGPAGEGRGSKAAMAIFERARASADDPTPHLGLLAGERHAALHLAQAFRDAAGGPIRVRFPEPDPPLLEGMADAWVRARFSPRDHVNHVLERRVPPGEPVPLPDSPGLLVFEDEPRRIAIPPGH